MHWGPDLKLSTDSDSDGGGVEVVAELPARNEATVCGRHSTVDLVSFLSPVAARGEDSQSEVADVQDELKIHFSVPDASPDTDPLKWWPRHEEMHHCLSRMARQFLGVPTSSAAVERLFSGVGDFTKQRQAMSEETLEGLA